MTEMTECAVATCVRTTVEEYCAKHQLAYENLEKTFEDWKNAYGKDYTRQEYLERLADDLEIGAGDWVVEVANHLLHSS